MAILKILVVGRGQLAVSVARAQRSDNVEVIAVGRPETDLTAPETISRAIDHYVPQVVINCAAYTGVDKAELEPVAAYAVNAEGAAHVARACAERAIPLIHLSTDYVFDGDKPTPYSERDPVAPLSVYGSTKLAGEQLVAAGCMRHIILRTSWIFSPYGHNFVKTMLRLAKRQNQIRVVDDQLGNPTYAPHLAAAVVAIADSIGRKKGHDLWGIYHAAGSGEATWCELAREVFRKSLQLDGRTVSVLPITSAEYPTPARRPKNSRLSCTKLARTFGISLPDWQLGASECVHLLSCDNELP